MRIVGLGGGIGASRLWRVLAPAVGPARLTLVVNTAEDLWQHGLRICPDLDTTLYALSDRQDLERGWGLREESFRCMSALAGLGEDVWFNLGDTDLATHLYRSGRLRAGLGLAEVTRLLAAAMGVGVRVLPMTEQEVTTVIETAEGRSLHYEEFLVREAGRPTPVRIRYAGIEAALPAPGVLEALDTADLIVLAPSNPMASVLPILSLPGVRDTLRARRSAVIAVSPIVAGIPIDDQGEARRASSRAALLATQGVPATAAGVAELYQDCCSRFAVDPADAHDLPSVEQQGLQPIIAPLLFHRGADPASLLDGLLAPSAARVAP